MNALTMLKEEFGQQEGCAEIVDIGLQGVHRMQALIDSLLNLEHIESGVGLQCKPKWTCATWWSAAWPT
ncbi:MAG: hypothetical protein KatS3mg051_0437 [Anaerolineae bacterium]|nr:MAG: hypothetical protein KatS3mg051_0437 [Anaerolineae bacterium]